MKKFNDYHPASYVTRPGDGTSYSYLDHIEIDKTGIDFIIVTPSHQEERRIRITDLVCIELIPSLLDGKISCLQALENLESHLLKKHNIKKQEDVALRSRIYSIFFQLCGKDNFVKLCQFFPHTYEDRLWLIPQNQTRVCNEKIIAAIRKTFFTATPNTLKNIVTGFVKNNMHFFADHINPSNMDEDTIDHIQKSDQDVGNVVYSIIRR